MFSINLLPKNVKSKEELTKSEKSNISNCYVLKEIDVLNSQVKAADEEIKKEISGNKFLTAEIKARGSLCPFLCFLCF